MDKEFVPYDVAEDLRGLGMFELCHSFWAGLPGKLPFLLSNSEINTPIKSWKFLCPAPTYRQAFRFMGNRFALYPIAGVYNFYEEALLACLKQMIESAQPIRKLNGGDGADLCPACRRILPEGNRGYSESIDQQPVQ
jgi:hypothetical protein